MKLLSSRFTNKSLVASISQLSRSQKLSSLVSKTAMITRNASQYALIFAAVAALTAIPAAMARGGGGGGGGHGGGGGGHGCGGHGGAGGFGGGGGGHGGGGLYKTGVRPSEGRYRGGRWWYDDEDAHYDPGHPVQTGAQFSGPAHIDPTQYHYFVQEYQWPTKAPGTVP